MWKDLIERLYPDAQFSEGVSESALSTAGQNMGVHIPGDLQELLRQTNGVLDRWAVDVIWPIDQLVRDNSTFRTFPDFKELYMPFDSLLFFGDNGGGDQFAYVVEPDRHDIFVWDHENDSRQWVAGNLEEYLRRRLASSGDEWYRSD
ncbi:SMI1/KNR4 family protein [Nonomuraea sp. NPDC050680]|uniref:SMI1/KNR4 family protein n=1 Tax=Nonomuraea sp. NPDC050680 TaxID=3154630 RepID=UPI0033C29FB9